MMSSVEKMFLEMGFSWTMSKALPYVLAILLGVILVMLFKKKLTKNVIVKWLFRLTLLVLPFFMYFMYSPIYEGDFSNNSIEVEKKDDFAELDGKKLVVISIPGCPYCYQSIEKLLKLKERIPEAEIEFVVCNTGLDSLLPPDALNWYKEKGGDKISVRQALNSVAMGQLAQNESGSAVFPTFVLVDGKKDLKRWSNDSFGVVALDEVELSLK